MKWPHPANSDTKRDLFDSFHTIQDLIEEMEAEHHEDLLDLKDALQGQLQDLYNQVQSLRRELIYFQSQIGSIKRKK